MPDHYDRFAERKAMIDRFHRLPILMQARELVISRGSVYYLPRAVSTSDLALQRPPLAQRSGSVLSNIETQVNQICGKRRGYSTKRI